jgi:uncharacterized damage-inducible protein DinB
MRAGSVARTDLAASRTIRILCRRRGLRTSRLTLTGLTESGFVRLGEEPGRAMAPGIAGRFWTPGGCLLRHTPEAFAGRPMPGTARAGWGFRVAPAADGQTRLVTSTRVQCADARARRRFLASWLVVAPFSGVIRRAALAAIRRQAEATGGADRWGFRPGRARPSSVSPVARGRRMRRAETLLPEFDQEMATTRRLLERVPGEQGPWKPHAKSFPLGHLAQLVSWMPGWITNVLRDTRLDLATAGGYTFETTETLLAGFDRNVREARETIAAVPDASYDVTWSLTHGNRVLFSAPRGVVVRQTINHLVHHRGQLTVYLRLLDVPIPPIYGPTADEGWG